VPSIDGLNVDLKVVLGRRQMPVHMLLRMGRGAVIELDQTDDDTVEILANDHPIARGQIIVTGTRIQVEITEIIPKPTLVRDKGVSIGDGAVAAKAAAEIPPEQG
jgi:flagellar motor switch protein FliN/FliY